MAKTTRGRSRKKKPETMGERIRLFRANKGLTQIELGRRVGLSSRMMAYYEVQNGTPDPALLARLAEVLDVSIEALMGIERVSKQSTPLNTADVHLWRRVKRIAELPPHDRKTILKMIDAMANEAERRKAGLGARAS